MTTDWYRRAACKGASLEMFFSDSRSTRDTRQAVHMCFTACPVREACLDDALRLGDTFGVRGGLTATQRSKKHSERLAATQQARHEALIRLAVDHLKAGGSMNSFLKAHHVSQTLARRYFDAARKTIDAGRNAKAVKRGSRESAAA